MVCRMQAMLSAVGSSCYCPQYSHISLDDQHMTRHTPASSSYPQSPTTLPLGGRKNKSPRCYWYKQFSGHHAPAVQGNNFWLRQAWSCLVAMLFSYLVNRCHINVVFLAFILTWLSSCLYSIMYLCYVCNCTHTDMHTHNHTLLT